jgi:hypothetical protein
MYCKPSTARDASGSGQTGPLTSHCPNNRTSDQGADTTADCGFPRHKTALARTSCKLIGQCSVLARPETALWISVVKRRWRERSCVGATSRHRCSAGRRRLGFLCSPEATKQPEDWEQDRGREPETDKPPQHDGSSVCPRGGKLARGGLSGAQEI